MIDKRKGVENEEPLQILAKNLARYKRDSYYHETSALNKDL
jgi:hypothetical protein